MKTLLRVKLSSTTIPLGIVKVVIPMWLERSESQRLKALASINRLIAVEQNTR